MRLNRANKHYIRVNENWDIICGFSDAFERPNYEDICVNEKGGRQFQLLGEINPRLKNENGVWNYRFADGSAVKKTRLELHNENETLLFPRYKSEKQQEMNLACKWEIYKGVTVKTNFGEKHFSLTAEDQSNIDNLSNKLLAVRLGVIPEEVFQYGVPYHSDGDDCVFYSADDFMKISAAKDSLILYHTTYCNQLKQYIDTMGSVKELKETYYGMRLPEAYLAKVGEIVGVLG